MGEVGDIRQKMDVIGGEGDANMTGLRIGNQYSFRKTPAPSSSSSSSSSTSSPSTAPSTASTTSESSTSEGETKELTAFKKELQTLLVLNYRFSVKRSGSSLVIQCIADHIPGAPGKVRENLDKLIRSFESAIGSKNLKEGDHYEAKNKQVKAKSWELTVVAKSVLAGEVSSTLDSIAELLEAAGYPEYPE